MDENKNMIEEEEINAAEKTEETPAAPEAEAETENEAETTAETPETPADSEETKDKGQPEKPAKAPVSNKTRRRLVSICTVAVILVAIILLNVFATVLTNRFSVFTADITSNSAFEISDQSKEMAHKVTKDVTINFLSARNSYRSYDDYFKQAVSLAEQLAKESDGHIRVEFTDLVQNPSLESKYPDAKLAATDVIVSCGDKYNVLSKEDMFEFESYASDYQYISGSNAEQVIDEAIMKVTSDVVTKLAMITDYTADNFDYLRSVLKANNYECTDVSIETEDIPADTDIVMLLAPTKDYSKEATQKLGTFINNDNKYGKYMIAVAYRDETETPNIDALLSVYGLAFRNGLAFDMDTSRLVGTSYYSDIASSFISGLYLDGIDSQSYPVLISLAKPVVSTNNELFTPLIRLSEKSGFCPFDADEETWSMPDSVTGKVYVAAAGGAGTDDNQSIVVALGSSIMLSETYLQSQFSNQRYMLNMLATFSGREPDSMVLEKKVITQYDITLSRSTNIVLGIMLYAVLPLLIVAAGFIVYFVRRRK